MRPLGRFMSLANFLDSINTSLEYQYDKEKKSGVSAPPRLFITLLRQPGTGAITVGEKAGFHVRLVGSLSKRTKHVMEYSNLDKKQAEEYIIKEEKGRKKWKFSLLKKCERLTERP